MSLWREAAVVARLDFAEVRRSRWLIFSVLLRPS